MGGAMNPEITTPNEAPQTMPDARPRSSGLTRSSVSERVSTRATEEKKPKLGTSPAYITGRRWDLLAWNRAACSIFGDFAALPAQERNIVRFIFTNGELRRRLVDWEGVAQRALAQFRASSSQYTDDMQFAALIADLQHSSLEFARWRPRHEVQGRRDGRKELIHPQVGYMALEYNTFQVNELPDLKVVVYLPASEETASKLKQLLGHEAVQV